MFRLFSIVAFGAYGRVPLFGALRASVAIIRQGELFLAIERSDDQGYSLPGGLALPWEKDERVLTREVHEETGLQVDSYKFLFTYFARVPIPCNVNVFEAEASGHLRDSWEGTPHWVDLRFLQSHIALSQRSVIEKLRR
jgi:8-oxo-dGTP pyrophosphatase MutT (NUDIX family)